MTEPTNERRRLPAPLADPLRTMRWVFRGQIVLQVLVCGVFGYAAFQAFQRTSSPLWFALPLIVLLPVLVHRWNLKNLVPRDPPHYIYLRAFRSDADSVRTKEVIQCLLGSTWRLAGIRAPRRRMPNWLRPVFSLAMAHQYGSSTHMELEAGPDWPARLWYSMASCRGAFLDLRDLTPGVHLEIDLAHETLGLERIAFIVDGTKPLDEWRHAVAETLRIPLARSADIRLLVWKDTDAEDREGEFAEGVRRFVKEGPSPRAAVNWDSWPLVQAYALSRRQTTWRNVQLALSILFGLAILNAPPVIGLRLGGEAGRTTGNTVLAALLTIGTVPLVAGHARRLRGLGRRARVLNPAYADGVEARARALTRGNVVLVALMVVGVGLPTAGIHVIEKVKRRAEVLLAENNVHTVVVLLQQESLVKGWPPYDGRNFVLSTVASGELDPRNPRDLAALFHHPPPADLAELARTDYRGVTRASLRAKSFPHLTSLAGRRNRDPEYRLRPSATEPEPIVADVQFPDGAVVGFTSGVVRFMSREELGLGPDDPIVVGRDSRSPILRALSDE